MKLKSISLRGMIGFSRGMHKEQVDLDLSTVSGIVALVGGNGRGKTTFLEAAQPFRLFPSRNILLKDAVNLKDSFKDLTFEMDGKTIRVLVTVNAASGQSDGYLWVDGVPMTKNSKVSEVDEWLEKLIGTPDLFFQSVFAAQSAESMLSLKTSKRKDFFVEFLGLSQLQEYSDKAKGIVSSLANRIESLTQTKGRLQHELDGYANVGTELNSALEEKSRLEASVLELDEKIKAVEVEIRTLEIQAANQSLILTAVQDLNKRLQDLESQSAKIQTQRRQELQTEKDAHASAVMKTQQSREELARENDSSSKTWHAPLSHRPIATIEAEMDQIRSEIEIRRQAVAEHSKLKTDYAHKLQVLNGQLTSANALAALARKIPAIADQAICSTCGFAQASIQAGKDAVRIGAEIAECGIRMHEALVPFAEKIEKYEPLDVPLRVLTDEKRYIRESEETNKNALQAVEKSKARAIELQVSIQHREETIARLSGVIDGIIAAGKAYAAEVEASRSQLQSAIHEKESQLDVAIPSQLGQLKQALSALIANRERSFKQAMDLHTKIGVLEHRAERRLDVTEELENIDRKTFALDQERGEWLLLQQICGRDKLQALELDAAAPAISGIANTLLSECFGGRFSVQFETMDEAGREVFDLIVTDMESGISEALTLKSGGQKVIVLHALRLAILVYSKERSGRDFKTLFMDESEAALDPETRGQFCGMLRKAMAVGGMDTAFVVTHSTEISDASDHLFEFTDDGIVVR